MSKTLKTKFFKRRLKVAFNGLQNGSKYKINFVRRILRLKTENNCGTKSSQKMNFKQKSKAKLDLKLNNEVHWITKTEFGEDRTKKDFKLLKFFEKFLKIWHSLAIGSLKKYFYTNNENVMNQFLPFLLFICNCFYKEWTLRQSA